MSALDPESIERALRAGRVEPFVVRAERAEGVAARRYARELAARAFSLADPGSVAIALRARARALGIEEAAIGACEETPPPHAVRVPLFDASAGDALVRMLWIEFDPAGGGGDRPALGARASAAFADALAMAAERAAPPRAMERFRLVAARPRALEAVAIDGESLGAAALVSAVSLWSERSTRSGIAVTGALRSGVIARVGAIPAKVRAAREAGCDVIVVPAEQEDEARGAGAGIEVIAVRTVEALLDATLVAVRARRDPERAVREARALFAEGWRGYRWPAIDERLARVAGTLPDARPDLQIETLSRLAAARRHLGDPEGSLRVLESARVIAESQADAVPDGPLTALEQQRAMTELKLFRFRAAAQAAQRAITIARRARLRGEHIKALGCAGLVEMGRRRDDAARACFDEALALTLRHAPEDAARSRVYLMEALGRLGRDAEARAMWRAAMHEVAEDEPGARGKKESWVRTGWGGALVALARWSEAREVLDVPAVHEALHEHPLPGLRARRHLGLALARGDDRDARERGLHLLASSTLAHGRALEPGLRSLAHVNVLVEAEVRVASARLDEDATARTRAALAALPTWGDAPRWLGAARGRVERALAKSSPDALGRALRELVARCEAI
ncbi:S16 family serine protease [Sandaracinus amylolyticus]|uniref:Response regulator receiver n=1 Tax=Sandaracinus amylolyticus TaxID=927083 RepID=A0A0F6SEA7_9BACT|nr:S16 family serine protease [Sandaracinus amylolyticus]AKF04864.1 response regulator receiver [Sandaracinus amylolyticus]